MHVARFITYTEKPATSGIPSVESMEEKQLHFGKLTRKQYLCGLKW